ncbi:hypothetical protein R6Q59_009489 [Mikania micrantha]
MTTTMTAVISLFDLQQSTNINSWLLFDSGMRTTTVVQPTLKDACFSDLKTRVMTSLLVKHSHLQRLTLFYDIFFFVKSFNLASLFQKNLTSKHMVWLLIYQANATFRKPIFSSQHLCVNYKTYKNFYLIQPTWSTSTLM